MENGEKKLSSRKAVNIAWIAGAVTFLLECAAGYYYNVIVAYYHSDGISRVANAFYVLYSRNPHLGAIGFVWNPLPSFVDMIFLTLYPLIPEMATKGIAGLLMSAVFSSLTVVVAAKAFLSNGLPRWSSIVFPLLFALSPMIFIFGFNGMSDAPFMFFIVVSVVRFLAFMDTGKPGNLFFASMALALAFWCRYEAVPFGFALILSAAVAVGLTSSGRSRLAKMEGVFLVIATPLIYSALLWLLLNALIVGNPFYFLNGEYSNISQIQGHLDDPIYASMLNNPVNAFIYAAKKIAVFSVPFASILLIRALNGRLLKKATLILICLFLSIPMLQVVMLMRGTTLAWTRYFIYVLPVSFAWLPYELGSIRRKWHITVPLVAMAVNFCILSYAITQPSIAPDENTFLQNSFGSHTQAYYDQQQWIGIADYLDENYPESSILADSFSAYMIILESHYPKRFFISSDYNFKKAISDPSLFGVEYILIPKPGSPSVISAVNNAYPNLFEHGADWAELVKSFGDEWRLYRVTKSTGATLE